MPISDRLVRQLNIGGLDRRAAIVMAQKHAEQRVVKVPFDITTPHLSDGTLVVTTLLPGDMLLGYALVVEEVFGTTVVSEIAAPNPPTLPLTIEAGVNDVLLISGGGRTVAAGIYATAVEIRDLLNATIGESDVITVSVNGSGHLVLSSPPFHGGAFAQSNDHPLLLSDLGFTGTVVNIPWANPNFYLMPPGGVPGDGNELISFVPSALDVQQNSGLRSFDTVGGTLGSSQPIGYLLESDESMKLRMALVNGLGLGETDYPAYPSDGTGKAFLWMLISSLF